MISMPSSVRPAISAAATLPTSSRPPMRAKPALLCALLTVLLGGAGNIASAQTAQFTDAQKISYLISGINSTGTIALPSAVAADGKGNVYFCDSSGEYIDGYSYQVDEILAVDGTIPAYPGLAFLAQLGGAPFPCGVAVDASGNVYFTDDYNNAVKEILAVNGSIRTVPDDYYASAIAVDGSGNVYVADLLGGTVNEIVAVNGSIPASPTFLTLASGFNRPNGLAVDGSGNVYVADTNNNAVKEIVAVNGSIPASPTIKTLGSGFLGPFGVALDSSGNVYVADDGNEVKEMLAVNGSIPASPTILTLADDVGASGVAVDIRGNVYAPDPNKNGVMELSPSGGNFGQVNVGTASTVISMDFTFSAAGTLGSTAVFTQGAPNLDFTDAGTGSCKAGTAYTAGESCTIDVIFTPKHPGLRMGAAVLQDSKKNALATGFLQGVGLGPEVVFSPATLSTLGGGFGAPYGVAVDGSGNVYVADSGEVKEMPPGCASSSCVATLGGGFVYPEGLAVDGSGNVYVSDWGGSEVKEMPPGCASSNCVTKLGGGFATPIGVAVDRSGNVYVAEWEGGEVKEMPPGCASSSCVTTLGGGFDVPAYVAVDGSGNVFVTDQRSPFGLVKEMPPGCVSASCVTTLGGGFSGPSGVAVDGGGNVYVSDYSNGTVKEVPLGCASASCVATLGSGFGNPEEVAVDGSGNVYIAAYCVANNGCEAVKEFDRATPPTLSFATTAVGSTSTDSPKTVQIENIGNAALDFTALSYPADFAEASGDANACTSSTGLSAGQTCDLPIDFTPQNGGLLSENVTITDNALNVSGAQQSIAVSGTSTGSIVATHLSVTAPANAGASAPFNITVTALDASGGTATGYTGTVSFTSTDASAVLSAASKLTAGTGTFPVTLETLGSQTITATDAANSLTGTSAVIDVSATPPGVFPAQGSLNFGSWAVGSPSGAQTLNFTVGAGTTVGSIAVVTQGVPNLDFTNAAGTTCTATTYSSDTNCVVNVNFTPTLAGTRKGAVVFSDGSGNVLATVYLQGSGTGAQVNFLPGTESTIPTSGINWAGAVAVDGSGNVYVFDVNNSRILKMTWTGSGYTQSTILSGPNVGGAMSVDGAGNLYISQGGLNQVVKETWTGNGYVQTTIGSGLYYPSFPAVDGFGNVYIADAFNGRVLKETLSAGSYTQSVILTCGVHGEYTCPSTVAVDGSGNVYVSAFSSSSTFDASKIMKLTPSADGYTQSTIGSGMSWATQVAVDGSGNLFVADDDNSRILRETLVDGNYVQSTVSTSPLNNAWGVAVDGYGNLYIADTYSSKVLKEDLWDSPTVSFAETAVGSTSTDSPQTVQIENVGNAALNFTGLSYPADFVEASGDANACTSSTSLSAGQTCDLRIDFTPQNGGLLSENVTITDNALNVTGAQQSIAVTGTVSGPASQTITFPLITAAQYASMQITLSATATSGLPVTFTSTTTAVCTVAGTTASLLTPGTCTIDANQAGNSSYNPAPMVAQSFTVSPAQQTITFTAIANLATGDVAALSATASSGLPIAFSSATSTVCTVSGSAATMVSPGLCILDATQAGSNVYAPASTTESNRVYGRGVEQQTITFIPISGTQSAGTQLTLSATASSGLAVSFASTTPAVCSVSGSTLSLLTRGTCIVEAWQFGNSVYAPTTTGQSFAVFLVPQTITFTPITGKQYVGTQLTLSATVSSGLPVTFSSTTPSVCSVSGSTLSLLIAGTCIVHATQAGDSAHAPVSSTQSFFVHGTGVEKQTITFTPISGTQYAATQLALSATASSGLPVTFTSTTTSVCTVAGSAASLLAAGTCTIDARQAGDNTYAPAPMTEQSFPVSLAPQTITFPAIANLATGEIAALSATASSGLPVVISSATTAVCTVSGSTATMVSPGICILGATQAGNSAYAPASSVQSNFVYGRGAGEQTITFAAFPGIQYAGTQLTLSATATSGLPVIFFSTTPAVCFVSGGTLSLSARGTCIVHAWQFGNSVYAAATTGQSFAVSFVSQTIAFSPIAGKQYAGTQLTLSATASSGLPVTFSSTTPAVCSVSGSTLSLLDSGTCIVHAGQAGNGIYAEAPPLAQSFAVRAAN